MVSPASVRRWATWWRAGGRWRPTASGSDGTISTWSYGAAGSSDLASLPRRLGIAAMAAKLYPEAKRRLIERGRPADEVERMPVIQVAALDTILEYHRVRDDHYKWLSLPYWQSAARVSEAEAAGMGSPEAKLDNPLLTLFRLLTPALNAVRLAQVRLERHRQVQSQRQRAPVELQERAREQQIDQQQPQPNRRHVQRVGRRLAFEGRHQ